MTDTAAPRKRNRTRPLTAEGIALRQSLADAEAAARAAHYALEAANVRAARYYRAVFIATPVSLALGVLLGRLA